MSAVAQAVRVVCSWCGHEIQPGDGDVSHGLCDERACHRLIEHEISAASLKGLFMRSELLWGRYRNGEIPLHEWDRARTRAENALDLYTENMLAEIRRLRVAAAETEH